MAYALSCEACNKIEIFAFLCLFSFYVLVLTNNRSEVVFYDLSGAVAKDDAEVKVSKLLQNDFTSCGDLIIAGLCEKLQSRLAGYTVVG